MLGVDDYEGMTPADELLKEYGEELGVGDTFNTPAWGSSSASPARRSPTRTSAARARRGGLHALRSCMVGCRYGAKNTLVKNYLWFAERLGVEVLPERRPPTSGRRRADGSDGYEVTTGTRRVAAPRRRTFTARGVVVAAGALGTNQLLATASTAARCRGSPTGSATGAHEHRVDPGGHGARRQPRLHARGRDHVEHLPDPDTHIEVVTYGGKGRLDERLFTP